MRGKFDVFYVFILSILGHSPRRSLGLKLPNLDLGAPPTGERLSRHNPPPLFRGQEYPFIPFFSALWTSYVTGLKIVLLPYLPLSITPTYYACVCSLM